MHRRVFINCIQSCCFIWANQEEQRKCRYYTACSWSLSSLARHSCVAVLVFMANKIKWNENAEFCPNVMQSQCVFAFLPWFATIHSF